MNKKLWALSLFCASSALMFGIWIAYHLWILVLYGSGVISEPKVWIALPEFVFTLLVIVVASYTWKLLVWR